MNRTQWLNHLRKLNIDNITIKDRDEIDKLINEELKVQEQMTMERAGVDYDGVGLDDGLDGEDVAAAMRQRAVEDHVSSGKVRAAYYNAYCYLRDLEDAARDLKNERMGNDAREALNHLDHIHDELEDKYKWD